MSKDLMKFEQEFGLTINEEGKVVTNSLKVAEYYGKEHKDVLKKIRGFIELIPELAEGNFSLSEYKDITGRKLPMFKMDRAGFSMLVNKFTGDDATIFTYKYTKAFEEMIEELEFRREQNTEIINALNERDIKMSRRKMLDSHFGKRKTVSTFRYCDYEQFQGLITLFEEYIDGIRDAEIKRKEYGRLVDGLTKNRNNINPNDKMYMPKTTTYSYYIHEYVKKKGSSENKSYGQKIRYKDEIIKEQQEKLSTLNPSIDEYMCINIHGLSNNSLYETVLNEYTGKDVVVKTYQYKKWLSEFPTNQLIPKEELNVDWDKPIMLFYKFDCKKSFDVNNLEKSATDTILTKFYGENDNIVDKTIIERNVDVEDYTNGKIYVCIRNVE